jgi:hypothetical protein
MKKIFTLIFLLSALNSNAQRTMFGSNNNYVAPVGPPSLVSALVLDLDAGNSASYAGTGTTWTDLSGKGNHGTLVNSVTYNSSNLGSLVFNGYENGQGPNPYVLLPTNTDFDFGSGDFTVEMWIYMTPTNEHPNFLSINVDEATNYAAVRLSAYQGSLGVLHSSTNSSWLSGPGSGTSFTLNTWKHIVLSRISGQATIYLDGISKLTYLLPASLMSNKLNVIGTITPNFANPGYFNLSGKIAVTRIYKGRGLTAAEALTQFDLTKSRFGL